MIEKVQPEAQAFVGKLSLLTVLYEEPLSAFAAKGSRQLNTIDINLFHCSTPIHYIMEDPGGLVGLRDLYEDLLVPEASRLRNVDRLCADLEARVSEFRQLLDKPAKNETSRKALSSGETSVE